MDTSKCAAIIPVIDPTSRIIELAEGLIAEGFEHLIVVDDGSAEAEAAGLFARLEAKGAVVVHHGANRGKGAAIKTGIREMLRSCPWAEGFVTIDGDGQHTPQDAARVCAAVGQEAGIALGVRDFKGASVPLRSRVGNAFSAAYFRLDTGRACSDTQTGLRCVPAALVPLALQMEGERYEYEMNFLTAVVRSGAPVKEVPIQTIYENGNKASHFDPVRDSMRIYRTLIRFTMSSVSCAVVDLGLFTLLVSVLHLKAFMLVALATCTARLASGALNFTLNKVWSFRAHRSTRVQACRYAVLFCLIMAASTIGVSLLSFLPVPLTVVKVIVDGMLFVISYFAQRNWVFRENYQEGGVRYARSRTGSYLNAGL